MNRGLLWLASLAVAAALGGCGREPVRTVVLPPSGVGPSVGAPPPASAPVALPAEPSTGTLPPASAPTAGTPPALSGGLPPPVGATPGLPPTPPAAQVEPGPSPSPDAAALAAPTGTNLGDPEGARLLAARSLMVPVAGMVPGRLEDHYTLRRGLRQHEAIDIMAPVGTPVVAVDDGRVAKLFKSVPGGLTVYQFDGAGQLSYYYAHLDRYAKGLVEGQLLRRGDLIGYVGATGNANPQAPHLHFAVFRLGPMQRWWEGRPVNPYPALRRGTPAPAGSG